MWLKDIAPGKWLSVPEAKCSVSSRALLLDPLGDVAQPWLTRVFRLGQGRREGRLGVTGKFLLKVNQKTFFPLIYSSSFFLKHFEKSCVSISGWAGEHGYFPLLSFLKNWGASLVVCSLRICLPMQGTQVQSLAREEPTCHGATKSEHHNSWSPCTLQSVLCNKRSHHSEKPIHHSWRVAPARRN